MWTVFVIILVLVECEGAEEQTPVSAYLKLWEDIYKSMAEYWTSIGRYLNLWGGSESAQPLKPQTTCEALDTAGANTPCSDTTLTAKVKGDKGDRSVATADNAASVPAVIK